MATLKDALKKIDEYTKNYRKIGLPAFQISGVYSLFPEKSKEKFDIRWPEPWPNGWERGIYLILGDELKLLYVGKASLNSAIGSRLGSYFSYSEDRKGCNVKRKWSENPIYVVTLAVPKNMSFEASALEEFLILEFKDELPDNSIGTK